MVREGGVRPLVTCDPYTVRIMEFLPALSGVDIRRAHFPLREEAIRSLADF